MKFPSYLALLVFFIYFISLFCCTVPLQFLLLKPLKNQYQPIKKLTAAACAQVRKLIRQKHHLHLSKWWWLKWATQEKEMNRLQGDSFIKLLWKYWVTNNSLWFEIKFEVTIYTAWISMFPKGLFFSVDIMVFLFSVFFQLQYIYNIAGNVM